MLRLVMFRAFASLGNIVRSTMKDPTAKSFALQMIYLGASLLGSGLFLKWAMNSIDPAKESKQRKKIMRRNLQDKLGRVIETDNHEDIIAAEVIHPNSIDVTMDDIGGLEETKSVLHSKVILPIQQPGMYRTFLLRQAKGVLLYGPPGTGKTMLAKALANEAGCSFINVRASGLQSKWFGETQKLVQALFTLAYKIQPCIIFIDEVDSLLGKRRENEHEATTSMKTEFMQLWDGFCTDFHANVMVLAATNRPWDLDEAVLRRFALQLEVGMPTAKQREAILRIYLEKQALDSAMFQESVGIAESLSKNTPEADGRQPQEKLAEQTEGLNGSDLLELCSRAAALAAEEHFQEVEKRRRTGQNSSSGKGRPKAMELRHFTKALRNFKPATQEATAYQLKTEGSRNQNAAQAALIAKLMNGLFDGSLARPQAQ